MGRLAVVILNWNGKDYLSRFLPSVIENSPGAGIIVADNASTDDSVAFLQKEFPSVRIILNSVNGGFARGYNDALKQVDADYYVLLNSDVEVTPGWTRAVTAMMDSDSSLAAVQPKLLSYHQKNEFEYAGAAGGFIDKYGYPFCRGRIMMNLEKDNGQYDDAREIFWASGACMFVRATVYRELGGMDEDFFAHMEEIDLCWRMKNRGYKVAYCPGSKVYHVGAGTLKKSNPKKTYLNFRNNLFLLFKNHAPAYFLPKIFLRMVMDGIAAIKFFFSDGPAHGWAVARAHFSFYFSFGKVMNKRRNERKAIRAYTSSCIYRKSIVWQYYLAGKKKFSDLGPIS